MPQNAKTSPKTAPKTNAGVRAPKASQLERTELAVMEAMTELLREVGYRQITVDLVAQRSGVARSTIYRRWASLPILAIAAFDAALGPGLPSPDHGDVETDLIHLYRRFTKILANSFWGELLPSLIEASKNEPAFDGLLARLDKDRRVNSLTILKRGVERGEIDAKANLDWIIDSLSGMLYYRFLISGGKLNEKGLVEWAVRTVLAGCAPSGGG